MSDLERDLEWWELEQIRDQRIGNPKKLREVLSDHKEYCVQDKAQWQARMQYHTAPSHGNQLQLIETLPEFVQPILYVHLIITKKQQLSGNHEVSVSRNLALKSITHEVSGSKKKYILLENESGTQFEYQYSTIFRKKQDDICGNSLYEAGDEVVNSFISELARLGPYRSYDLYADIVF